MHPNWVRSLRDQCQAAGVAFHLKQWGEYGLVKLSHSRSYPFASLDGVSGQYLVKVGRKKAGRELDGEIWDEFPVTEEVSV